MRKNKKAVKIKKNEKVLIVIDMQNDFLTGSLSCASETKIEQLLTNVDNKINEYESNNCRIFYTMDTHDSDYLNTREGKYLPVEHCEKDSWGWQLEERIKDRAFTYAKSSIVLKDRFGAVYPWADESFFEPNTDIEIIGVATNICVISNALILRSFFPEINISVDASCCMGTNLSDHYKALSIMEDCHIDITNNKKGE